MPLDKTSITSSITVSTGALVLTSRIYMNPAVAAAFAAVTSGHTYPVVTVGPSNAYVQVVTTTVPDTPVGVVAETHRFVEDHSTPSLGTIL